jgi:seryl-tRNA synthetase
VHDLRTLLELGDRAESALRRRSHCLDLQALGKLGRQRAESADTIGKLRAEANQLARGKRDPAPPADGPGGRSAGRELKERIARLEAAHRLIDGELTQLLLAIPNIPADSIPDGADGPDATEVHRWGSQTAFDFEPRDHTEIGERANILDLKRASKLSGARFSVTRGAGAVLERALASFFLDLHTREHGYREYAVPCLVTRQTMTGTGQLPKFEDDLLRTEVAGRELFLIPTAEVPLTNLYADEILDAATLPVAVTAYTRCFRGEAGSYGRDTRGILRQHEFGKVELVRLCAPERSEAELALLLQHAESCLRRLGLTYRVVLLAAGDLGFSARMTYDIEAWLPSQQQYREISSCSDCGTFQARRARIRMKGQDGRKTPVATLNGSGLPIGRTLVAILEQYQRQDGGVRIPEALVPYTGFSAIAPDGTPMS